MELTFECPKCRMIDHTAEVQLAERAVCRHCGTARELKAEAFDAEERPRACPLCGGKDLYVRKDFSTAVGLAIVITGFAVAAAFWYYGRSSWAYSVLAASVLLDVALHRRVPDVVVCYRCAGQLRGSGVNSKRRFRAFDLGVGERFRRERPGISEVQARGVASVESGTPADASAA